jgi:hypothetical protein
MPYLNWINMSPTKTGLTFCCWSATSTRTKAVSWKKMVHLEKQEQGWRHINPLLPSRLSTSVTVVLSHCRCLPRPRVSDGKGAHAGRRDTLPSGRNMRKNRQIHVGIWNFSSLGSIGHQSRHSNQLNHTVSLVGFNNHVVALPTHSSGRN